MTLVRAWGRCKPRVPSRGGGSGLSRPRARNGVPLIASPSDRSAAATWALRPDPAPLRPVAQLVPYELVRALRPVAQNRARIARVDDLLDAEALGGAERRSHRVEAFDDLRVQGDRIVGRLELAAVRGLDAALDRERSPVARRPREAKVQSLRVAVPCAGHAEHLAHEHRDPGHGRLVRRVERARAAPNRALLLRLASDQEAGLVDEVHD